MVTITPAFPLCAHRHELVLDLHVIVNVGTDLTRLHGKMVSITFMLTSWST